MSRKSAEKAKIQQQKNQAKISGVSADAMSETSRNMPAKGDTDSSTLSCKAALRPTCPDPTQGFQPLSDYLVKRISEKTMEYIERICRKRNIQLDMKYWLHITKQILKQEDAEESIIVSSCPGSGKSTWIEAFALTLVELFKSDPELDRSIVGLTIVLQKVEDLNRLAAVVNQNADEDTPNMVVLQSWTEGAQQMGFCRNLDVHHFAACSPASCPYASSCEMLTFKRQAPMVPIIGLTQKRFEILRRSGNLDTVLYRENSTGRYPRRYLIFDEKFQMAQIDTLDMDLIERASAECSKLIEKPYVTDSQVRSFQQNISFHITKPFQTLRGKYRLPKESGGNDIQAGNCSLQTGDEVWEGRDGYYNFRDYTTESQRRYPIPSLAEAFSVMDHLYSSGSCLFSKTNNFVISRIHPPQIHYGTCQTIIFDATAQVDEDYHSLEQSKFLSDMPQRTASDVMFHIFTNSKLNVSKQAMKTVWKIPAFSQLIAELIDNTKGDIFLCTYKAWAKELADALQNALSPDDFKRILLMPSIDCPNTLPYLGGTNGSNCFHTATTVFMLGYPRLNPQEYLIRACAAYGSDVIKADLEQIPPERLVQRNSNDLYNMPSMKRYIAHHLAARLEQEIYRCAIRNPDFDGQIQVYLFCPPEDMLEILLRRIPGEIDYHDELPPCVEVQKGIARNYGDKGTSFSRLSDFIKNWDGAPIHVQALQENLQISKAVWKDLMRDPRVTALCKQHNIQCTGKGPNRSWRIPDKACA